MQEVQTLIVGGGISGLTSAWQLASLGEDIQLWEADSTIGGKIATHHDNGWTTEQSASMVLNFRPEVSQFLTDTGLDDYKLLRTPTSKRYLIHQDSLQEMPLKMSGMLFSPLWTLSGKLRLLVEPFILKGAREDESVADFIRRRLGQEMLDKALSAYISGTLASDPELADSRAVLPHLTALEQRFGSLTAGVLARKILNKKKASITEGFSFRGGMSTLIDELSRQLGGTIHAQHRITNIEPHPRGWLVCAETPDGEKSCIAERLILSTPAPVTAKLVRSINPGLHQLLADINYVPVSVVHLGYHRRQIAHPLEGTGFLTPFKEKLKLNGSMWMHSLFARRAPEEHVLLSNYLGGSRYPQETELSIKAQIDTVCSELESVLNIKGEPGWQRLDYHQNALPLYHGRYLLRQQLIAQELERLPGLYLQANYLGGVSIRDRIVCAQQLAKDIGLYQQNKSLARSHGHARRQPQITSERA